MRVTVSSFGLFVPTVTIGCAFAATITNFDVSGAAATSPMCINEAGTIAGYYADTSGAYHGFVRTSAGMISVFDAPGASSGKNQDTESVAINRAGTIVGLYSDANGVFHGFVRAAGGHNHGL